MAEMDMAVSRAAANRFGPCVVGIDEVGRGAWAGDLVMVAAVAGQGDPPATVNDSKRVPRARRPAAAADAHAWCSRWAPGQVSAGDIDRFGMAAALRTAAAAALDGLGVIPDVVLVDGGVNLLASGRWASVPVVCQPRLDGQDATVAAASLLAKVLRDQMMADLDQLWPGYGWADNAGYPAPTHRAGLARLGPCPQHRVSWRWAHQLGGAWRDEPWTAGRVAPR